MEQNTFHNNRTELDSVLGTNTGDQIASTITNDSTVTGAKVSDALNTLKNSAAAPMYSNMLFVDVNGNDLTGDGTILKPYATAYKAMSMILDASPTKRYAIKYGVGFFTEANAIVHKPNVWITGETAYSTRVIFSSTYSLSSAFSGALDNRFGFENIYIDGVITVDMSAVSATIARMYNRGVQFNKAISFVAGASTCRFYMFDCETYSTTTASGGYISFTGSVFNGLMTVSSNPLATTGNAFFLNCYLPNGCSILNGASTEYLDTWFANSEIRNTLTITGWASIHYSYGCLPWVSNRVISATAVVQCMENESQDTIINTRTVMSNATNYPTNTQTILAVADTSVARNIILGNTSMYNDGYMYIIKDESGGASVNNITITRSGADTIEGATSISIKNNYGFVKLYKATSGKWMLHSSGIAWGSGLWASKPTTNLITGQMYFDTALKKPYYYNSSDLSWYDAAGIVHA